MFVTSKIATELLKKNPAGGVILNTSSMAGINGAMANIGYTSSKFAVEGLTLGMARELGKYNIRVNAVAPAGMEKTDVNGNIILSTATQQYGGFTVPKIDKVLAPYAEKSYKKYKEEFIKYADPLWNGVEERAEEYAINKVRRDFDQGWQGIEYKLNTVGSSRGDYPFVTVTIGLGTQRFEKMCNISLLNVHKGGQGRPVITSTGSATPLR